MRLRQHSSAIVIVAASFWLILIAADRAPEWKEGAGALTNDYMKSQIEGTELKLTCPAKGRPKPELMWYKDDNAFFPRTDSIRAKGSNLKFMYLKTSDTGNYTCVAQNPAGTLEFTYIVDVVEKIWPLYANVSSNLTVNVGDDARFYCIVTNDDNARIQWLRIEQEEIARNIFLPSADDSPEILILYEVQPADAGQYTCIIGNEFGSKYQHMYLTVIEPTTTTTSTTSTTTTSTTTTTTPTTTTTTPTTTPTTTSTTTSTTTTPVTTTTTTTTTTTPTTTERSTTTAMEPITEKKKDKKRKKDKKKNKKDKKKDKKKKNKKKDRQKEKEKNTYDESYYNNEIDTVEPYPGYDGFPYDKDNFDFGTNVYGDKNYEKTNDYNDYNSNTDWYEPTNTRDQDPSIHGYDPYVPPDNDKDNNMYENDSLSGKNETNKASSTKHGGISVWTVYIIVGAVAGGILLAGLVAIAIALCCQREEDPQYKSTSV